MPSLQREGCVKANRILLLCIALPLAAHFCTAQTPTDHAGCKDSPLIGRFPGSVITNCTDSPADGYDFTVTVDKKQQTKHIGGEFHQLKYNWPKTASKSQVVHNLNIALKKAGYTFDYDSGDYGDFTVHMGKTWIMEEVSAGN
jgi:hypothetical protein